MFKFLSRSSDRRSASIRQALVEAGLTTAADPTKVTVVESKGNYSGVRGARRRGGGQPSALRQSGPCGASRGRYRGGRRAQREARLTINYACAAEGFSMGTPTEILSQAITLQRSAFVASRSRKLRYCQ